MVAMFAGKYTTTMTSLSIIFPLYLLLGFFGAKAHKAPGPYLQVLNPLFPVAMRTGKKRIKNICKDMHIWVFLLFRKRTIF